MTLYELSKLPVDLLTARIADHTIDPKLERRDIRRKVQGIEDPPRATLNSVQVLRQERDALKATVIGQQQHIAELEAARELPPLIEAKPNPEPLLIEAKPNGEAQPSPKPADADTGARVPAPETAGGDSDLVVALRLLIASKIGMYGLQRQILAAEPVIRPIDLLALAADLHDLAEGLQLHERAMPCISTASNCFAISKSQKPA